MLINDLQEAIAKNINDHIDSGSFTYLKDHIYIKFIDKDDLIGLVPLPGSHMISKDYSGLELWLYNYEVTLKTKSRALAHNRLFELSQFLQELNETHDLQSSNKSWVFDSIEIREPAEVQEDLQGKATYSMDFSIYVYKNKGVK